MSDCSHVFVGTPKCQLCGITELQLLRRERADAFRLLSEQARALDEARALWVEWSETDITDDDDRWADFTNRVHAWLLRNPARTKKPNTSTPA